jgi:hypothetical protein
MAAPTELARKLGVQPGMRVALLRPPAEAESAIRAADPGGVRWTRSLRTARFHLIFFWPLKTDGLSREFARLQASLVPDGAIWAVIPKKAFAAGRGVSFNWEEMQAEGLRGDLVDNKVATITATDYGTRFVIRKARRQHSRVAKAP